MPFYVIRGRFHATGYSPDGDSLRFEARNKKNWSKLDKWAVQLNANAHAQLRFEGVDSLETHFQGVGQPAKWAHAARDFTMAQTGIKNIVWGPKGARVTSSKDGTDGYIIARQTDLHGRPVAFVFAGAPKMADGSAIYLKPNLLRSSLNYKLTAAGLAYPLFYDTLFWDLRKELQKAALDARKRKLGIWRDDASKGFTYSSQDSIKSKYVIFPKLFRRLVEYGKSGKPISKFSAWDKLSKEAIIVLPNVQTTHFDTVIHQSGKKIGITEDLLNLIFVSEK